VSVRIAHFSDIHITEHPHQIRIRDLLSKRFVGWLNLRVLGRYSALSRARQVVAAFVRDLATETVDHVVCTGDYTGQALPSEFDAARSALAQVFDTYDVTTIPGNHDVYVRSAVHQRLYESRFSEWDRSDLRREDFPESVRSAYPYPLVRFLGENVTLVALRDARPTLFHDSSGHVPAVQLAALKHILQCDELRGGVTLLALHYGLRRGDGAPDSYFHKLRNAEELIHIAQKNDVSLVLHGHIHHRFVHPQGRAGSFAIANPGALAYAGREMSYHVFTIDKSAIRLETRRYDEASDSFVDWPDAPNNGLVWTSPKALDERTHS